MENKEKFLNSTAVLNILVMVLTIAVVITCISCLWSVERAREKMADIEAALLESGMGVVGQCPQMLDSLGL